jgi:outer membrane cobalamin receptor
MRSSDTALLIDGLRFRDAAGTQGDASGFFQDMTIVDTERIEFLRGSGSSLYGSHAMAGVINVNSSQGGGKTHGEIRAEGGGLGLLRGVARVGGGLADNRFIYSGGFSHLNVTDGYRERSRTWFPVRPCALPSWNPGRKRR